MLIFLTMTTNIKVENKGGESNANLLRRFSRRVRYSGLLNKKRGIRYYSRDESDFKQKQEALRRKRRNEEVDKLVKLGKLRDRRRHHTIKLEDDE